MPEFIVWRMAQCVPDDPAQLPQFSDCPRQGETTRRTIHSIVRLCAKCAEVWDEQEREVVFGGVARVLAPASRELKVSLEVLPVTWMSEAGHRVL